MPKKKLNRLKICFCLRVIALLFILGALITPFAPALKMVVNSGGGSVITIYSPAFSFIFGGKLSNGRITYNTIGISIIGLISFILVLLAFLFLLSTFIPYVKTKFSSTFFLFLIIIMLTTSAILLLTVHKSAATVLTGAITQNPSPSVINTIYKNTSLQFGFYGISIFSLLASLLLIMSLFVDGAIDKLSFTKKIKLSI